MTQAKSVRQGTYLEDMTIPLKFCSIFDPLISCLCNGATDVNLVFAHKLDVMLG